MNYENPASGHTFVKNDDDLWECVACSLTSNNKKPPCSYCGAEDGEDCRLTNCEQGSLSNFKA